MSRWRMTVVFTVLMVACMGGAALTLHKLDQMRSGATLEEVLYIPSPQAVRRLSLGYTGLIADIYWTRAVQYFGSHHHEKALRYDLLWPLLDITTTLDPHLVVAYQFGSFFLAQKPPEGAGMPDKAVELVERGIAANPNEWKLYYNLGFIHYIERKDLKAASDAFARGAQVPGAHPSMKVLAATMLSRSGERDTARLLWKSIYDSSDDKDIRLNAEKHLEALKVDDDVTYLEQAVQVFKQHTGRLPGSFQEMQAAGLLRGIPVDPLGLPYRLMPDGRIEVQEPENLPFIEKGLPPGNIAVQTIKTDENK